MRQLEPQWMSSLKSDPEFFGNPSKTTYALKSAGGSDAITLLTQLYKEGQVPQQYKTDALAAIAARGQVQDLNDVFDVAVSRSAEKQGVSEELGAVENAATNRQIRANRQLGRLQTILLDTDTASVLAAMQVAGAVKVDSPDPTQRNRTKK